MKKLNLLILFVTVIGASWAFESCSNGQQNKPEDSVEAAKEANDTSNVVMVDEQDANFAVKAANNSMAEVEMAKTAEQKAMNEHVKRFAAMMLSDHTKASDDLKMTATSKNIILPSTVGEDHQEHITKLSQKSGKDFDKEYMDMMIDGHKNTIDLFEKEANNGKDVDLKTWATNTLPTLRMHLDSAKVIRDMLKK